MLYIGSDDNHLYAFGLQAARHQARRSKGQTIDA
jgi:hypothetical protein